MLISKIGKYIKEKFLKKSLKSTFIVAALCIVAYL